MILSYCANGPAKFPDPWENSREKSNSGAIIADKIFHINGLGDSSGTANREFSWPKSGKLRPNRELSGNFGIAAFPGAKMELGTEVPRRIQGAFEAKQYTPDLDAKMASQGPAMAQLRIDPRVGDVGAKLRVRPPKTTRTGVTVGVASRLRRDEVAHDRPRPSSSFLG